MPVRVLDYSALTEPVTRAEVAAWRTRARASGAVWASTSSSVVGLISVGLFAVVFVFLFGGVLMSLLSEGIRNGNVFGVALPTIFVITVVLLVIAGVRSRLGGGSRWMRWLRLDRFAQANGLSFRPMDMTPSYPGEIFQLGRDQQALSRLVSNSGRFLDIANYRYITGSGKSQTTHNWGYLALALDRAMPNIVLDAKANDSLFGSDLPARLDRKQILHLEGDFDRYFTLYCPAQYEQDALYIFTPDLMALLIDEAAPFDVELVDRWMFVYSAKPFELTDPAVLQRLFTIADTVGATAVSQTEHYADDRIGDPTANIVAPQGARLKRGVSTLGVVLIVAFAAYWGWTFFGNFFR